MACMSLVENKKARLRFEVLETYQAGLELEGGEVKSLRGKLGSLEGARVVVRGGEGVPGGYDDTAVPGSQYLRRL